MHIASSRRVDCRVLRREATFRGRAATNELSPRNEETFTRNVFAGGPSFGTLPGRKKTLESFIGRQRGVDLLHPSQQTKPVVLAHRRKIEHRTLPPRGGFDARTAGTGDHRLHGSGPASACPGEHSRDTFFASRMGQHEHVNPPGRRIGQQYLGFLVRDYARPVECQEYLR